MATDLWSALERIEAEDGQLKAASAKLGHEPEAGDMPNAGTTSAIGESMGRGPMDAKALLDEKGLEQAGSELEGRTFQDPRERSGARNLATSPGKGPVSPTDSSRPATKPTNVHLPRKPQTQWGGGGVPKHAASISGAIAKAKGLGKAVAKPFKATGRTFSQSMKGQGSHYKTKDRGTVSKALHAAGTTAKKHPKTVGGVAAGVAAAGAGGVAMHRRKKASEELTLVGYLDVFHAGEAGVKLAAQAYGQDKLAEVALQADEFRVVGANMALGLLGAKLAEQLQTAE